MEWLTAETVPRWVAILLGTAFALTSAYMTYSHRRQSVPVKPRELSALPEALQAMAGLSSGSLHAGNAVAVAENSAFFDRLAEDAAAARHSIHLETFIWSTGEVTARLERVLEERARAGVKVRLLMDAMGSHSVKKEQVGRLRSAGVQVMRFRPIGWRDLHVMNYRDHRKVAVIDGGVGWVMGHGFDDRWLGDGQDARHWRDTALRIAGPAVHDLQSAFAQSWAESANEVIADPLDWPVLENKGDAQVHVATSSSGDIISNVEELFRCGMAVARRTLLIANPYFAPKPDYVKALASAAKRGVAVTLVLPGKATDSKIVRHAAHACYAELIEAGVRVFEHGTTLVHQKVMIVDGAWSCVGSTNMDVHSLEMSEEISVGVFDAALAATLTRAFEQDVGRSHRIEAAEWGERSPFHAAADALAYVFRGQL